jgi:NADH-quinone oxidoreductase subunit F
MPSTDFLLGRCGTVDPESVSAFLAAGGLRGLRRAREIGPQGVIDEVLAAQLVGRGGAAFPTGRKWAGVAATVGRKYLICNADESEPGTFKDRKLLEEDPFAIVESMLIAGLAVGAASGYFYIRGEYGLAARRIQHAIDALDARGELGDVRLEVRRGGGAYICGEETALMNSIEAKRGEPRSEAALPDQTGLGQPTLINNVETLANVHSASGARCQWFSIDRCRTGRSGCSCLVAVRKRCVRIRYYPASC